MKTIQNILICIAALALQPAVRGDDEAVVKSDSVKIGRAANGKTILTIDEATQKRIGLAVANPSAADGLQEIQATGQVLDVSPLVDLLGEYRKAQITLESSRRERERARQLKQDDNISERAAQEAEAAYALNRVAAVTIASKIKSGWGNKVLEKIGPPPVALAAERSPDSFLQALSDSMILIRVDLPAGQRWGEAAPAARIFSLAQKTGPVSAVFFDALPVVNSQTQQQGALFVIEPARASRLMPGESITARIVPSGELPVKGVMIPAEAIVRHDNQGWFFVQTGASEFTRRSVPLEQPSATGYFCADLAATNRIVVVGAQTLLSAELSEGDFNSGQRD